MKDLIKSVILRLDNINTELKCGIMDLVYEKEIIIIPNEKDLIINDKVITKLSYDMEYIAFKCPDFSIQTSICRLYYGSDFEFLDLSKITNIQSLLKIANAIKDL